MKKRFLVLSFLLFIFYSLNLLAINFPEKANKVEDFIPKGWKTLIIKKGDLNKDKIEDIVLVIQKNDPKNFRKAESGYIYIPIENANFNPIIVLVLLKDKDSQYNLVAKNEKGFIVSEGKAHEEVLESLVDADSISIKNNTLRIYSFFEGIRGSGSSTTYILRYQNNRFELIGLEVMKGSTYGDDMEFNTYSINFSTKKLIKTKETSKIGSDDDGKTEKEEKAININKNYILENMTERTASEILEKYVY
ncbi:hypothetical protein KST90_06820 [Fusobacterium nucleatum]|uniref:hypothetical protein n=1 Tax=Fusobacterium nucleatum TaxID=851 RepID=UPI0030D0FA25